MGNGKNSTTRKRGLHLRVPVLPDEEAAIRSNAAKAGLSVAAYPLAEFIIKELGPAAIGVIGTAVGAWVSGRSGRKVRLKIGDIEAEGRTIEEITQLLQHARTFQADHGGANDEA